MDPIFNAPSLDFLGYEVQAVAIQPDGKMLVAGGVNGIARLNADGSFDTSFTGSVSTVNQQSVSAVAIQTDGKIVLAGNFSMVNGSSQAGIARLNSDGSLDTGFAATFGTNHSVSCVAIQADGKIVLGGGFTIVNGATHKTIARLNGDGSLDPGFTTSTDGGVNSLAIQADGKIVLGGSFTHVNGASLNVARLNGDGSLDTSFTASTYGGTLYSLAIQADGKIVLGGSFSTVNGAAHPCIARLNSDGSLDTSFVATTDTATLFPGVYSLAIQADGKIVLGGGFSMVDGVAHPSIARLNGDGSLDTRFTASTSSSSLVQSLAIQADGKIVLGGVFKTVDGLTCNHVARVDQSGGLDPNFLVDIEPGPDSAVRTQSVQADGKILLVGAFTQINGTSHLSVGRLNSDGSLDTSFTAGANNEVVSLAIQADGKIVLGGSFSTVNGAAHPCIARLNSDGSLDTSFAATTDGNVNSLAIQADGKIVLGGSFTHVNGMPLNHIARLNGDGSLDTSFTTSTDSTGYGVFTLAIQADGKIVLGGAFTKVNGVTRNYVARLNNDGSLDTSFTASISGFEFGVQSLAIQTDGKIVLGGFFTVANGAGHSHIARLNSDGSLDPSFTASTDDVVYSLAVQKDSKIVLAGHFSMVNGTSHPYVARLNSDGSLDTSFMATTDNGALSVAIQADGTFVLTGNFNQVNGVTRNYVARLNADGSVDTGFVTGTGVARTAALAVQPSASNPADVSALKVIVGGTFSYLGGLPANGLARLQSDGSLDRMFTAPFSPGDSVPAFALQPKDGNLVASRVLAATASSPNSLVRLSAVGPKTQSIIKNPIVRCLGDDGSLDPTFYTGAGTDGTAYALGVQSDAANAGRIVVAGSFTQLNSVSGHADLGRLNTDGTLDTGFNTSANGTVQTVLIQADGQLVIGGLFTQINGIAHARLARLNAADGTLDASFSTAAGTDGPVAALMQQSDGRLVVAGIFATVNATTRSCLARLNADGTLDATFNAGTISLSGGTALVSSVDQQTDGKLVIGGLFDHIAGTSRPNVARLNTDGSVDTTYNPGSGTDAIVRAVTLQPDGKTLLGGDFSTVDGLERDAAARLLGDYNLNAYPALGQWRIINFGSPATTGNAADTVAPYGDNVPNLLKYALNMNPQGPDASVMTPTGTEGLPLLGRDASGKYLTLTFVRRQAATAPGVSYLVEFASALASPAGFAVNPAATSAVTTLDATWERVTVIDSVPLSSQALSRFVHLRITDP